MKFFKKYWFVFIIVFIPIIALVTYLIFSCKSYSPESKVTIIGSLVAYLGTAILGLVAFWQNVKQQENNEKLLKQQEEKALEDKNTLLEHNRKIALDNARLNVLPFFSINQIPYRITQDFFATEAKNTTLENKKEYGYFEELSWYFAVLLNEEGIKFAKNETKEIKDYKTNVFCENKDKNGVVFTCERKDFYLPLIIKNRGRHDAINFTFSVYKDNHKDKKFYKSILSRPFLLNDELRLDIYIPDIDTKNKYWLELRYFDILGNEYVQKNYMLIDGENSVMTLDFKQELI